MSRRCRALLILVFSPPSPSSARSRRPPIQPLVCLSTLPPPSRPSSSQPRPIHKPLLAPSHTSSPRMKLLHFAALLVACLSLVCAAPSASSDLSKRSDSFNLAFGSRFGNPQGVSFASPPGNSVPYHQPTNLNAVSSADSTIFSNTTTSAITHPVSTFESLNIQSGILAALLIASGVVLVFFGHRVFPIILAISGFYTGVVVALLILTGIEMNNPTIYGTHRDIIFLIVCAISGIIFALLFRCVIKLGLFAVGALLGLVLAMIVITLLPQSITPNELWNKIILGVSMLVFGIAALFAEKPVFILATSFAGAYAVAFGVDVFARTGFKETTIAFFNGGGFPPSTAAVYGFLAGTVVLGLVGTFIQFSQRDRHGYHRFRGDNEKN
ncbi:uncharacterized protein BJ171DRAFT_489505 [Polychytrium aggregatum]|uniref:uncharacterized protein n=1 Tax=Polychytrium aggregatum TaxID=110093 RepID=UPI0022FDD094|nr:uncharacterized protein BJ171DRAFT_489505 [Polychytrium aggregatum]KAI9208605.1 hypothetical protein BJ171DRAFT_489505 [Polychytrium aggregatum]